VSTAYTTEKTWATGDDITASLFNTHIRDNSQFLHQPPCCRVYNSAAFSHTSSGNFLAVTYNSERKDTDTMHSTSSNTSRLTATTVGFYAAGGTCEFAANSTGIRSVAVRVNGTTYVGGVNRTTAAAGNVEQLECTTAYQLAATDYFEVMAYQSSGGTLSVASDPNISPEAWAAWQAA